MSFLYAVVFATRCRSNHQRLAVDALRHLRCDNADAWRTLLLRHHEDYLNGAVAPDIEFKDFKNHVLHPKDKDWGGAVDACVEWYRRTVRALKARDWRQAAWSAGVLSHYYVDPLQPFHTSQTEEEGVIHRAVEWSCAHSYGELQHILENELGGYPDMQAPTSEKWLAEMVKAGAKASNPHYDMLIEHYDLDAAIKDPRAGLDQEIKDVIARLIGHAVVGFARILERAFAESAVRPPRRAPGMLAARLALEAPLQAMRAAREEKVMRRQVEAQYEEYRRTGKVRGTLAEDEKVVRALYAAEVLKTPLSSLDARWPREIGARHGEGAEARNAPRRVKAAAPAPAPERLERERPPKPAKVQPRVIDLDTPGRPALEAVKPPPKPRAMPRELPIGAPLAKREKTLPRFTLSGGDAVAQAPSIGARAARQLEGAGVRTIADLLAMRPEDGERRLGDISVDTIRDWQRQALLACTVPGLKSREAQALVACGVRDAHELAEMDATALCDGVACWGLSEEGQRAWGSAPAPNVDDVATWIARARRAQGAGANSAAA